MNRFLLISILTLLLLPSCSIFTSEPYSLNYNIIGSNMADYNIRSSRTMAGVPATVDSVPHNEMYIVDTITLRYPIIVDYKGCLFVMEKSFFGTRATDEYFFMYHEVFHCVENDSLAPAFSAIVKEKDGWKKVHDKVKKHWIIEKEMVTMERTITLPTGEEFVKLEGFARKRFKRTMQDAPNRMKRPDEVWAKSIGVPNMRFVMVLVDVDSLDKHPEFTPCADFYRSIKLKHPQLCFCKILYPIMEDRNYSADNSLVETGSKVETLHIGKVYKKKKANSK